MGERPADDKDRAILAGSVVFQGLSPAELEPVLAPSEIITRKPRDLIMREGTVGDGLYVVLDGEVEVFLPEQAAAGGIEPRASASTGSGPAGAWASTASSTISPRRPPRPR